MHQLFRASLLSGIVFSLFLANCHGGTTVPVHGAVSRLSHSSALTGTKACPTLILRGGGEDATIEAVGHGEGEVLGDAWGITEEDAKARYGTDSLPLAKAKAFIELLQGVCASLGQQDRSLNDLSDHSTNPDRGIAALVYDKKDRLQRLRLMHDGVQAQLSKLQQWAKLLVEGAMLEQVEEALKGAGDHEQGMLLQYAAGLANTKGTQVLRRSLSQEVALCACIIEVETLLRQGDAEGSMASLAEYAAQLSDHISHLDQVLTHRAGPTDTGPPALTSPDHAVQEGA